MKNLWYIVMIQLVMLNVIQAQSYKSQIATGNKSFNVKNYTKAEHAYRKAATKENQNAAALYNTANSIYKLQSMNEAVTAYQSALKSAKTKNEKHQLFHNMGNAFMKLKDYSNAVEAYKNALRNNPTDEQTRYNYALAKKMQKENPDQNKNNKQNQDQNKDKKDQDKKDDQNKDQKEKNDQNKDKKEDKGDQDKKDQQNNNNKENQKEKEQPKPSPQQQKQNQSKQQMDNILKALDNHEKGVRERIQGREQKGKPVTTPTTKDW